MEQVQDQGKAADAGRAEFPTDANGYKILCQIGVSEHSVVYKAICESMNSTTVAVKVVDMDGLDWDHVKNIINSLSLIQHPNILSPHCSFMMDRQLWIVMPFIHVGSLETLMAARFQNGLPDQFLAILLHQLLSGLACLHQLGYVHKDIKPSNIFIDSEGTVKLSDVNVFKPTTWASDEYSSSLPYWVAPELGRSDGEYSSKSDIWAIGIVALEITSGCLLVSNFLILRSQFLKISRRLPYRLNMYNFLSKDAIDWKFSLSDSFKDFVSYCLVKDPSERGSAESLLGHPFIMEQEESRNNCFVSLKSIVKDMVGIEDMFETNKDRLEFLMANGRKEIDNKENGQMVKIERWDFNKSHFQLEPIKEETLAEKVGTIIAEEGKEEGGRRTVDEKLVLSSLRESLNKVIAQFGLFFKRELEMTREIERLKAELGAEKERSFELELVMRREIQRVKAELGAEKHINFHFALASLSPTPKQF